MNIDRKVAQALKGQEVDAFKYINFLNAVYPAKSVVEYQSKNEFVDKMIELVQDVNDPISFTIGYKKNMKEGNLSSDIMSQHRLGLNYLTEKLKDNPEAIAFAESFMENRKEWYRKDPKGYVSQFYKTNQNTSDMGSDFKNWVVTLPQYQSRDNFQFEPMTITTDIFDQELNELILDKFGYDISPDRGFDAIAVSKSGRVYCIEAKYVGEGGGHQTNQIAIALNLAKQSNGKVSGLFVLDGAPAISGVKHQILSKNFSRIGGRLTSSYNLIEFLEKN